jgi:hypothetical protein
VGAAYNAQKMLKFGDKGFDPADENPPGVDVQGIPAFGGI